MRGMFEAIASVVCALTRAGEVTLTNFAAESSDFVRFNRSAVRHAGSVDQQSLSVDLIRDGRLCGGSLMLSGDLDVDRSNLAHMLEGCRERLTFLPTDPHLLYATAPTLTEQVGETRLPGDRTAIIAAVAAAGRGADLVGLYAGGSIYRGFANSLGQRNWFASHAFNLDWSYHLSGDKAVKANYADFAWNAEAFAGRVEASRAQLAALARPPRTIPPGRYRAYLSPTALKEILRLTSWGFGLKGQRTKQSPLLRMLEDGVTLSPLVTLWEGTREGVGPNFQSAGYVKPDKVLLLEHGRLRDPLVSPRSAKEYGVATNGADDHEGPSSLDMAAGELAQADILRRLDTGVYVNNLWYLNYSDRPSARITGMTRFATFWVERGEIVAPVNVMRFDDTLYNLLGTQLEALTSERDLILDTNTYGARSTDSTRAPGVLLSALTLTL